MKKNTKKGSKVVQKVNSQNSFLIPKDNSIVSMKTFFKECLYEDLNKYSNADAMRKLFVNIIYNGFQDEKYSQWSKSISKKLGRVSKLSKLCMNNKGKSEKYYAKIKKKKSYDSVIIGEDAPSDGAYLLGDNDSDKKGPYYNSIKKVFNNGNVLSDTLIKNKVLFFDLLTIPVDISSNLRKKWSTDSNFMIDGKRLPVFLLEIAFDYFKLKNKINNAKIAIMMPTNTAVSIYNYFELVSDQDYLFCLRDRLIAKSCWKEIENGYINIIEEGKCFNYYKSNTISGSNTPDADLLKYALNIKQ